MPEMPRPGEHHRDAVIAGGLVHLVVAHRAAGLDDGGRARLDRDETCARPIFHGMTPWWLANRRSRPIIASEVAHRSAGGSGVERMSSVGPTRTSRDVRFSAAIEGRADIRRACSD
jgi:hypothetical protein